MSDDLTDVDDFIDRENERRGRGDDDGDDDVRDFVNRENERRGHGLDGPDSEGTEGS
jgi:hypothetical protein